MNIPILLRDFTDHPELIAVCRFLRIDPDSVATITVNDKDVDENGRGKASIEIDFIDDRILLEKALGGANRDPKGS